MGNLGDILARHAKRHGIERQVEAVGVVEAATSEIAKIIPEEDFEVISYSRDILKIAVNSAVVGSEIQNHAQAIRISLKPAPKRIQIQIR